MNRVDVVNQFFDLGYKFGRLIYILDADEDFAKDVKLGRFNALKIAYGITASTLPQSNRQEVLQKLNSLRESIDTIIHSLPISLDISQTFILRLKSNLHARTHQQVKILKQPCNTETVRLTMKQKWDWAREKARQILEPQGEHLKTGYFGLRKIYLSVYFVLVAILSPQTVFAQESESSDST